MKKTTEVVRGKIENLKRVTTRTENSMVTFMVGGTPCKAFGKGAEMLTRWMQHDPNSVGEFEGYFDRRSEKYGREFVAAHGKLIETKTTDKIDSHDIAASGAEFTGAPSAAISSAPIEHVPAKQPIEFKTDLAVKSPSSPLPCVAQASASFPVVNSAPVRQVTFEDLENEYKLLKMKCRLEKANEQIMTA